MTDEPSHLWKPGQSGNPNGRTKGSRNKATKIAEALLDGEAETLVRKLIEMALAGDATALRVAVERLVPPRKDRPIEIELPPLKAASDAVTAISAIISQVADGTITPSEAGELSRLVDVFAKTVEMRDFEERLARLEAAAK